MNRTEFIGTDLYYSQNFVDDKNKEIERLNNIIKEIREYIYNNSFDEERKEIIDELWVNEIKDILEILDKGDEIVSTL